MWRGQVAKSNMYSNSPSEPQYLPIITSASAAMPLKFRMAKIPPLRNQSPKKDLETKNQLER
jgi:hypothetical protein